MKNNNNNNNNNKNRKIPRAIRLANDVPYEIIPDPSSPNQIPRLKFKHPCRCGCGEMILVVNFNGRPSFFKDRKHRGKYIKEQRLKAIHELNIECYACGATETLFHKQSERYLWYPNPPIGNLCSKCYRKIIKPYKQVSKKVSEMTKEEIERSHAYRRMRYAQNRELFKERSRKQYLKRKERQQQ